MKFTGDFLQLGLRSENKEKPQVAGDYDAVGLPTDHDFLSKSVFHCGNMIKKKGLVVKPLFV